MRPTLEVADIFRCHGEAFRRSHGAHLGRIERRVMAAIELCRTPALGGHVEQCGDCGLVRCAYNSCRNPHESPHFHYLRSGHDSVAFGRRSNRLLVGAVTWARRIEDGRNLWMFARSLVSCM